MNTNKTLLRARRLKYNEYYTSKNLVQYLFNSIPEGKLQGKNIYCPCDSEQSEFVKFLQDEENKKKYGYVSFAYTSDDWHTHDDLFEQCDVVVTNPPFTGIRKFIDYLYEKQKDFVIVAPLSVTQYQSHPIRLYGLFSSGKPIQDFMTDNGEERSVNNIILASNFQLNFQWPEHVRKKYEKLIRKQKKLEELSLKKFDNTDIYNVDRIADLPVDYYGLLGVPTSICLETCWAYPYYEILGFVRERFIDGKCKYVRVLVQRRCNKICKS